MKTYLRRWWLINRLYHLIRKRDGKVWLKESDLCAWIGGTNLETELAFDNAGNFSINKASWFYRQFLRWLYDSKNYDDLYQQIRNVVHECEDKEWIKKHIDGGTTFINLDTTGRERYPVTSLIGLVFGNSYIKTIILGIIMIFLTNYITNNIINSVNRNSVQKTSQTELRSISQ